MTDTGLIELAERCEKATGPDLTLDAKIGKAVGAEHYALTALLPVTLCYTASLDAAMTLVPEEWEPLIDWTQRNPVIAELYGDGPVVRGANPDAALALCAAALRARAATTPPSEPTEK